MAMPSSLPTALDLMVVCVESGLGIDQTIVMVAKELETAYPEISEEFAVMNLEMRAGKRRAEALHNLAERTGVRDLRKLAAVLVQTDRFGKSIAQCLLGHSDYLRVLARQRAEERAAKLAIKLGVSHILLRVAVASHSDCWPRADEAHTGSDPTNRKHVIVR